MGLTAFNRKRRERAAKANTKPLDTSTAPTSEPSASELDSREQPHSELQAPLNGGNVALTLINTATSPDDLTPIPTIGKGAAKVILQHRPNEGYESLELLPEAIFEQPYRCSVEAIAEYQG